MPGAFIVGRNNKALVVVLTIPPGLDRGGWVGKITGFVERVAPVHAM